MLYDPDREFCDLLHLYLILLCLCKENVHSAANFMLFAGFRNICETIPVHFNNNIYNHNDFGHYNCDMKIS